ACKRLHSQQTQNIVWIGRPIDDALTLVDDLAVMCRDVLVLWNKIFMRNAIQIGNHQSLLAFGILAERHDTGNLGQDTRVLGRAGFKQFSNTRQATSNVTCFRSLLRNPRQYFPDAHLLSIPNGNNGTNLEGDIDGQIATCEAHFLTLVIQQFYQRAQALRLRHATPFWIDYDERGQTGYLINLLRYLYAFFHVFEAYPAGIFCDDGASMRIPGGQDLT